MVSITTVVTGIICFAVGTIFGFFVTALMVANARSMKYEDD